MCNQPNAIETKESFRAALDKIEMGDPAGAEKICKRIGSDHPEHAAALHLMGVLAYRRNDLASALKALSRAVAEKPFEAAYRSDLGLAMMSCQEHSQALKCFIEAVRLQPGLTSAHNNGGLSLLSLKRPEEALHWFKRALSLDPYFAQAHLNLGLAYRDQKNIAAARKSFESALAINPDYAKAHFLLGDLSQSEQDISRAVDHFQHAIRLKPDYLAAYNRLAVCLAEGHRFDESIFWMSLAIEKFPHSAETFCNYGNMLRQARAFPKAADMYRRAIELKPDWAEAHFNLGLMLLLMGNLEQGWPEFEWRLRQFSPGSGYPNRHGLPLWQDQPLTGKTILVYDEQGFGDVFLFMRYLPQLKKAGARVVLETRPELISIFKKWPHIDGLVARHPDMRPDIVCDYCLPLASLPGRLGTVLTTIPSDVPYLQADPVLVARWAKRMAKGTFKLGVVWSGSNIDTARNLDLALLAPIAQLAGVVIYGLQKYTTTMVSVSTPDCLWIDNLGPELNDFADTAAAIANCDLILTIDTSVAHLAGAMAHRAWVLLPYVPDWRWFLEREDTPWYPTLRLFRQEQPGNWTLPLSQVLVELKRLVADALRLGRAQTPPRIVDCKAAETFYHQAQTLQSTGQLDQAILAYEKALAADPGLTEARYNLGVLHYQQGRWREAADCFRTALSIAPDFVHAAYNLAVAYDKCGLHQAAVAAYRQTLAINATFAPAAYNLGLLFFKESRYRDAAVFFRQAISADPNHYDAYNNLGLALHHDGQLGDAVAAFEAAIRLKPDFVPAYQNLGNAFMDMGQWDQTISCYQKALSFSPHAPLAHYEMGKLFLQVLDLDNARRCFEKALVLQPDNADARYDLAQLLLMQGRYLEGWKHFVRRFESTKSRICIYPHTFDRPLWDGSVFQGRRLFVHCEQGFGDTIQFARFIPMVKNLGGEVIFQVQPSLLPLFEGFPGVDRLMALTDQKPESLDFDMVMPLMNLPGCLHITESKVPNKVPYLYATKNDVARWKTAFDPNKFNIGIVWSGNPIQVNNPRRACLSDDFLSLSTLPGIQLYSLQKNLGKAQQDAQLFLSEAAIQLGDRLETFGDTAAVIENLDLIITVDTSVAHLAGAMGKPVWILLCHLPDWRWGLNRSDCLWYPTAKLFRQCQRGAWQAVFAMVREALIDLMDSRKKVQKMPPLEGVL
jgi:tetratricopeptide (TPR) repeat protein